MQTQKLFFQNNKLQKLAAKIYKDEPASSDGIIFCHGMLSTKDGYKITHLAEDIVNAGFTLLTFDFSCVGESEGNISDLSIFQEVDDLNSAFLFFQKYGMKNIHLVGSSMGALVALLYSSVMGGNLCSQTLIAAPVLLLQLMQNMAGADINSLPDDGQTVVDGKSVKNIFFKEALKVDIETALANTTVPSLVIHGGKDTVVPFINAAALTKNIRCDKRVILIEDGDHNLTRDSDIEILRNNIIEWVTMHCA